ncbi:hypothetical protein MRB53_037173 [Persea americana]|nr:hypothetical protein MRB53_037173 [Persea americana]
MLKGCIAGGMVCYFVRRLLNPDIRHCGMMPTIRSPVLAAACSHLGAIPYPCQQYAIGCKNDIEAREGSAQAQPRARSQAEFPPALRL